MQQHDELKIVQMRHEISMWDQIRPKLKEGETIREADARGAFTEDERAFIRNFAVEHFADA